MQHSKSVIIFEMVVYLKNSLKCNFKTYLLAINFTKKRIQNFNLGQNYHQNLRIDWSLFARTTFGDISGYASYMDGYSQWINASNGSQRMYKWHPRTVFRNWHYFWKYCHFFEGSKISIFKLKLREILFSVFQLSKWPKIVFVSLKQYKNPWF